MPAVGGDSMAISAAVDAESFNDVEASKQLRLTSLPRLVELS